MLKELMQRWTQHYVMHAQRAAMRWHSARAVPTWWRCMLLRSTGVRDGQRQGAALASYLLFESAYTQELIDLGEQDGMAQREALSALLQPSEFTVARAARRQAGFRDSLMPTA